MAGGADARNDTPLEIVTMEKEDSRHIETRNRLILSPEDEEFLASVDETEARKIFWKVDTRLVPMLAVLYLFSHLDRANIGKMIPLAHNSLCASNIMRRKCEN